MYICLINVHLWQLGSGGSLACESYCDKIYLFLRSTPRTGNIHTCWRAFGSETGTTRLLRFRSVTTVAQTSFSRRQGCSNEKGIKALLLLLTFEVFFHEYITYVYCYQQCVVITYTYLFIYALLTTINYFTEYLYSRKKTN